MLQRLFALLTAVALTVGLSVAVASPASANSETCNSIGYQKPPALDRSSGDADFEWGTLTWSGRTLQYAVAPGWNVDLCIKSGSGAGTTRYDDRARSGSITISQDISHLGFKDPQYIASRVDCSAATLSTGRGLTNGDHINMTVAQDGRVFQVNASIDIAQAQDPASASGLVARLKVPGQPDRVIPLTRAEAASGDLAFTYSQYLSGTWTVRWVQFNSTYFNQSNLEVNYFSCTGTTEIPIDAAPSAVPPTCSTDGRLALPAIEHVTWTGGVDGAGPGRYVLVAQPDSGYAITGEDTFVVEVLARGAGLSCDEPVTPIAPAVAHEVCDATTGDVVLGELTFTRVENLTYTVDGVAVVFPAGEHTVAVPVAAGRHTVGYRVAEGFVLAGTGTTSTTSTVTVAAPATDCVETAVIPLDPFATPQVCVEDPQTGSSSPAGGSITIVHAPHVTWTITDESGAVTAVVVDTPGHHVFPLAAGDYLVTAAADPGYVVTAPASFRLTVREPASPCVQLPTHAVLDTGATWTHQVCTAAGLVDPTITVAPFPGVSYLIDGRVVTTTTTTVAPGEHLIEARADDPSNTVTVPSWNPTLLAASTGLCGDLTTLALTGETPGGWLLLAVVLLLAGVVLIAIRLVRERQSTGRHAV